LSEGGGEGIELVEIARDWVLSTLKEEGGGGLEGRVIVVEGNWSICGRRGKAGEGEGSGGIAGEEIGEGTEKIEENSLEVEVGNGGKEGEGEGEGGRAFEVQ